MRIKPILFFGVVAVVAGYLIYRQADPNEINVGKLLQWYVFTR